MPVTKQQALDYHLGERPGKIEVTPSKPCRTQKDLSLAYTLPIPAWRSRRIRTMLSSTPLAAIWSRSSAMELRCSDWGILERWRASR